MKRQLQLLLWITVLLCGFSRDTMAAALDNWHVRNTGPNRFSGLIFANDLFVALGGPIMTSPDGVTWTARPYGIASLPRGIAYGNGRFVLVATDGTNLTSTDGINWTPGPSGTASELWDVTFANGQFVAVGRGASLLTSPDGLNWTGRNSRGVSGMQVRFGDGKYFVLGNLARTLSQSMA